MFKIVPRKNLKFFLQLVLVNCDFYLLYYNHLYFLPSDLLAFIGIGEFGVFLKWEEYAAI